MKNKNEIRNINIEISHMEKRDDVSDKLSGYAIVFNVLSEPIFIYIPLWLDLLLMQKIRVLHTAFEFTFHYG